jgi:hypothetical protein
MNRVISTIVVLIFVLSANCQKIKKTQAKQIKIIPNQNSLTIEKAIKPNEYVTLLGEGIDVDWVKTSNGEKSYNRKMVTDFKKIGFEHVRIRVTEKTGKSQLKHLEKVVNDCLLEGLIPIVAFQAEYFKIKPNLENLNKVVAWWEAIATKFKTSSPLLSFDIIIEVTDDLNKEPELLNQLHEKVTSAIRKTNPYRIIFISPRLRSDPAYLHELKIPTQHNNFLMAETHFYALGPSKTKANKQWTTGTEKEKDLIKEKIKLALDWHQKTGIYIWIGAWMAGNYADENNFSEQEQISFASFVSCEFTKNKIPFAINADHHFYKASKNEWIENKMEVLKTILNTKCK